MVRVIAGSHVYFTTWYGILPAHTYILQQVTNKYRLTHIFYNRVRVISVSPLIFYNMVRVIAGSHAYFTTGYGFVPAHTYILQQGTSKYRLTRVLYN